MPCRQSSLEDWIICTLEAAWAHASMEDISIERSENPVIMWGDASLYVYTYSAGPPWGDEDDDSNINSVWYVKGD